MKDGGKRNNVTDIASRTKAKLDNEIDELFKLPLAEFTAARNALAARLKQNGRADDANRVKTLVKPPISAWAVNQLYWQHREAFDRLLALGERVRQAQTSGFAGKIADIRGVLDARREALSDLSELASSLLSDAGHNPTPDTIRRITTTLEAISAVSDGPTLGRLSQDVDPPGFESLASLLSGAGTVKGTPVTTARRDTTKINLQQKPATTRDARQLEQVRQAKIAAAKISLQTAKKSLTNARAKAQRLDAAQKKADAEAKLAEKRLREAEERLKKASAAAEAASERAQSIASEAEEAAKTVADAESAVEEASNEVEALFSERSAR